MLEVIDTVAQNHGEAEIEVKRAALPHDLSISYVKAWDIV